MLKSNVMITFDSGWIRTITASNISCFGISSAYLWSISIQKWLIYYDFSLTIIQN